MLISVAIFSGVILGLAGLAFQIAKKSTRATDQALSMGRLLSKVDIVSQASFDSLPALAGCDTTASGPVNVIACIAVTQMSPRLDSVRIVVKTTVPGTRADTVVIQRSRDRSPLPLR